jgi:cysteine-rich repeat protein
LVVAGCVSETGSNLGMDAGAACIDVDRDGFGQNCALGFDCDDNSAGSTNECRVCSRPDVGCACDPNTPPEPCFLGDQALGDGRVMCTEGTRSCRDGAWSRCENAHSYVVTPEPSLVALINPDASPENCSICDITCFKVTDPLLLVDGSAPPGMNVAYGPGGGLTLAPTDAGMSMTADGGEGGVDGGPGSGCTGLALCCDSLAGQPQAQGNCLTIAAAGNVDACNAALQSYCPQTITGPLDGCIVGSGSLDVDCDGIPDSVDECTPATVASNPNCQGSVLPLSGTNNQTIFHVLDEGESASNSIEIGFQVRNADIYFMFDMTGTMNEARNNLVTSMQAGNFVECALLRNCCETLSGTARNNCRNIAMASSQNQNNCRNAQATYCAASPQLAQCPDLNFDGQPDNDNKTKGVVGAIRCLIGSSWFGAGMTNEIGFTAHGDKDDWGFRHFIDMTNDVDAVRTQLSRMQTDGNSDYPEAQMQGLYSVLTGKGHFYGHESPNVPERAGAGCAPGHWGYPCFRPDTVPIVVFFTDARFYNGPPVGGDPRYSASYVRNGNASSSGVAQFTPRQAESFATALNLGSVNGQFKVVSGNLQFMTGDLPGSITGCSAESSAPEALYRFTVDPLLNAAGIPIGTPLSVPFAMNVRTYNDGGQSNDARSPATQSPVVLSLYNGVPSAIQAPQSIGGATLYAIPSGPDLTYLTYTGSTSTAMSATGVLGGISGCGADGSTNQVAFTFRPVVNAHVIIDASESGFGTAVSLHEGQPSALPANPTGADRRVLVGPAGNTNDTFATAFEIPGNIDNEYKTFIGDTLALQNAGSGSKYNTPTGKSGRDDYDDTLVACDVNPVGADAVFKFDVGTRRRVRIDTEGTGFNTVISLHDGPPPEAYSVTDTGGNGNVGTSYRIGQLSGDTVSDASYAVHSAAGGTTGLGTVVAPVCGMEPTVGANDAFYSFRLASTTHLNVRAEGRSGSAMAGEAINTPGSPNAAAVTNPAPGASGVLPVINELVIDHAASTSPVTAADAREFVEILGQPNTSYANYRIIQVNGDASDNPGTVTAMMTPGITDGAGYWVTSFMSSQLDDGSSTLLLVECPSGGCVDLALMQDLDTGDNGAIDADPLPWVRIADEIAILDGDSGDQAYASTVLTTAHPGGTGTVGGASRMPSGRHTDSPSDWMRNDYAGDGLPGFGFDPYVFLYTTPPGAATHIDVAANDHNIHQSAANLFDLFGQVTTYVDNANLGHVETTNDYAEGVVSCAARTSCGLPGTFCEGPFDCCAGLTCEAEVCTESVALGRNDHVYKFRPSRNGTVRLTLDSPMGSPSYAAMALYDDVPPNRGGVPLTPVYDASLLADPPGPSCTAYSRGGHVYWFCAQAVTWDTAAANCNATHSTGHLARIDDAGENSFVAATRTSAQTWIGGRDIPNNRTWLWANTPLPNQFWSGTASGTAQLFSAWQSGEPNNTAEDCVAYYTAGSERWFDRSCTTGYHYVCEIDSPTVAPPENAATAYNVDSIAATIKAYAGATRRMQSDYAPVNMGTQCGAALGAPDAVFRLTPSTTIDDVTFDTSGSDFQAIVAVFQGAIDVAGYLGCDAPGVQPNTDVTSGVPVTGADPLELTLSAGETYYVLITGTAAQREGSYKLKISDPAAGGDGVQLACAVETGPAVSLQADFEANKTYYVVVEATGAPPGPYSLIAHSVYRNRYSVENPTALNEHGNSALVLGDPYRSKIQVGNTSTEGMIANYTAAELTCGSADGSPDAVYEFTPSIGTTLNISAQMTGPPTKQPVVALFRGRPESQATLTNVDNSNEARDSAFVVNLSSAQELRGDTSAMSNDVDGSLLSCGAAPAGRDAVFRFTLPATTTVEIDASASTAVGMLGDPVIALFRDFALDRPAPLLVENDSYQEAMMNPSPTPSATDGWLVYEADMINLTAATQTQVNLAASNDNDVVQPVSLTGAQQLGNVFNTRVTVGGGDTRPLNADYDGDDWNDVVAPGSRDAVFEFFSSTDTQVRIQASPSGWDSVIALYDGTNGAPLRAIENQMFTAMLEVSGCGNGYIDFGEECDDLVGPGCQECELIDSWTCVDSRKNNGFCDCGCGEYDAECDGADPMFCEVYVFPPGNGCIRFQEVPYDLNRNNLDPSDNGRCLPPACGNGIIEVDEECDDGNSLAGDGCSPACAKELDTWTCDPAFQTDADCECGCGVYDLMGCGPDNATNRSITRCDYVNLLGSCNYSPYPGTIDPTNNALCVEPANPNNSISQALEVPIYEGGTRRYEGTLAGMSHDVDIPPMCGAHPSSRDAIYEFTLLTSTRVSIDASASAIDPVVTLYNSAALGESPTTITLENDDAADADVNPSPTPTVNGAAFRYAGDVANLTVSTQPQATVDNRDNVNETTPTDLADPMNKRVTVLNASTAAMVATHPAPMCGGVDAGPDALYRFVPTESGEVRISTNYAQTTFDTVLALYDGRNGPPATLAQLQSTAHAQPPTNETEASARSVPIESGAQVYTGSTAAMISDVDASLYTNELGASCGAFAGAPEAVWSFSLSEPTTVEIDTTGTSFDGVIGVFDGSMSRPSTTQLVSKPASLTQLYDNSRLPGQPDTQCTPFEWNLHRYWVCASPRTWDGARAKCTDAGHDLVSIETSSENSEVWARVAPTGVAHSIGLRQAVSLAGWGSAPWGVWPSGAIPSMTATSPQTPTNELWYANEPNQAENAGTRMRSQDGEWTDTPASWGLAPFICEDDTTSPPALPTPPTASSPRAVDLFGHARRFAGSTTGVASSVGSSGIACSAAASAPDAVFRLDVPYTSDVRIEATGFSTGVVALFRGAIGPTGYTDAGSTCLPINPAAVHTRTMTPGTWYAVITSTIASGAGSGGAYDITFTGSSTDPAAFRLEPDTLFEAAASSLGPIENQWVVKTANMANLTTDLISTRVVDMGAGTDSNSSHLPPWTVRNLGSTDGQQVSTERASTTNLTSDYPAPMCGSSADSLDAIYRFSVVTPATVRVSIDAESGQDMVVGLFDGGTTNKLPLLKSEVPPMAVSVSGNDLPIQPTTPPQSGSSAYEVASFALANTYTGSVNMPMHVQGKDRLFSQAPIYGPNTCDAAAAGYDAWFTFTLSDAMDVAIDAGGTSFDHTIALFDASSMLEPAPITGSYDSYAQAVMSELPVTDGWHVLQGNTTGLLPGNVTRVTRVAGTDFQNDDDTNNDGTRTNAEMIQNLGMLAANTQLVTSGASTAAADVHPDYPASMLECGGSDSADDQIFVFRSVAGGPARITIDRPSPTFPVAMAVFDGAGGPPQTQSEINPAPVAVANTNNTRATAAPVWTVAMPPALEAYSGNTSMLAADTLASTLYNEARVHAEAPGYSPNVCSADPSGKDAFFRFTLAAPTNVRVAVQGDATAYPHTLALYNASPVTLPAPVSRQNDSRANAASTSVAIDESWVHYTTDMSPAAPFGTGNMTIEGLSHRALLAGTDFQNSNGVQDLFTTGGTLSAAQLRTDGADTTNTGARYGAPVCGGIPYGVAAANEMLFRVRSTTSTTVRVGVNNPTPGFNPVLAVYNGVPLTAAESTTPIIDLNAGGNTNETIASARQVLTGSRTTLTGNLGAMMSHYEGAQFMDGVSVCSPAATGYDAFTEVEVVTLPQAVRADLEVWIDAADDDNLVIGGGTVSTARDKSGRSNDVTQGTVARQPARQLRSNGYALELNPAGDASTANNATEDSLVRDSYVGDGPVSVFAVWRLLNTTFAADARLASSNIQSGAAGFAIGVSAAGSGALLQYRDSSNNAVAMSAALTGATSPMISTVTHGATGAITTFLNGTQLATGTGRANGTQYQRMRVGSNDALTQGMPMDLHELLVVRRAISATERQQIEGYLAHKWGLQASLPAGHPYLASPPTRTIEVSSAGSSFAHTLSFFDAEPRTRPAATAGTAQRTSAAALASSLGSITDAWLVRSATNTPATNSSLGSPLATVDTIVGGTHYTYADADHHGGGIPSLGSPSGKSIDVTGDTSAGGVDGDYPTDALTCGSFDEANDLIYTFTPTTSTRLKLAINNPVPSSAHVIGVFDGNGGLNPRDDSPVLPTPINIGFTAANYDVSAYTYANAVNFNCAGTTTFDSTSASFTTTTTCSDTAAERPQVTCGVAQTTAGGPPVCVLSMASFNLSGHTLRLVGDKPVILAASGAVTIASTGVIDANASTTTPGAGGAWTCSGATGTNGSGSSSGGGGGGGGGGFGTSGGRGGEGDGDNYGSGGTTRGAATLTPLLGGCNGGRGGGCTNEGGAGGGAFQISAAGGISVAGTLRAIGGAGINGCGSEGGGTGGGSGGAIMLESTSITTTGSTIQVNGGRGGNGANGGNGGNGSTSSASSGSAGQDEGANGGGGGGGGYGRTRNLVTTANTNEAPGTARAVTIGAPVVYQGSTQTMAANIAAGSWSSGTSNCSGAGNADAFFTFTLAAATPVRISTSGTGFHNALALWSSAPPATALACDNSAPGGAAVIEQTLPAGTYYVGISGNTATTADPLLQRGAYRILFENPALSATAPLLACTSTATELNVIAGRPYHVVVKGMGSGNAGPFKLNIDDIGAVPDMACASVSADDSAPDGFMAFNVGGALAKDVIIDMQGSMLEAVYELRRSDGTLLSCGLKQTASETPITQTLAPGSYYLKVRGLSAAEGRGELPFNLSIRDEDVRRAEDCYNGASGAVGATDTRTVPAGTYFVGIKPQTSATAGNYSISVRDTSYATSGGSTIASGCTSGSTIDVPVAANTDYYVMVKGEAAGERGAFDLTLTDVGSLAGRVTDIGCGDLSASDAFYQFTVAGAPYDAGNRKNVEVAFANSFDGAFRMYYDVGSDGNTANDTAEGSCYSGVNASHAYSLLPGTYYVVAKGRGVADGAAEMPMRLSIRDLDAIGSMECADGTSATPAAITSGTPLPAGTYYVAVTGQVGQQGAYELLFSNLDAATGGSATQIDCTSPTDPTNPGVLDVNLTAGTDYYVIVKGDGAADRGSYTLAVTDVSQIEPIDPACPADITAPDGYAAFNLSDGPRDVLIDMTGSTLVGALQVFAADGSSIPGCGCGNTTTPLTCTLDVGSYYVLYRGIVGAGTLGSQPFELVLRDESDYGAMACDDGVIAGGASIQQSLSAGTYYVGIATARTNVSTSYDYTLTINDSTVAAANGAVPIGCSDNADSVDLVPGNSYYAVVKGKGAADSGDYQLNVQDTSGVPSFGCGDDTSSPDAFYEFEVTNPSGTRVTIDTVDSVLPTVIALFPAGASYTTNVRNNATGNCCAIREEVAGGGAGTCTDGTDNDGDSTMDGADPDCAGTGQCRAGVACDARPDALIACDSSSGLGGSSEIRDQLLMPGVYHVVVRGRDFVWPAVAPAGYPDLPFNLSIRDEGSVSSVTCAATADAPLRTTLGAGTYHVALTGGGSGEMGNYRLAMREAIEQPAELACNTSSDSITYNVTANQPYYVVVKGATATERGDYRLSAENFELSSNMGCNADPLSPDAFYRFHLDAQTQVAITTAGSTLDTVIALYPVGVPYFGTNYATNSSGAVISCNDDGGGLGGASAITETLAPGDYYLVVKGKIGTGAAYGANSQPYTVSITDFNANAPITCVSGGSAIEQQLPAGDYKVVVSSTSSTGSAYTIDFQNTTVRDSSAAFIDSDDANDAIVANVLAGRPYYVVVKGQALSDEGGYGLTVESLDDDATSMGCGAHPAAADAFFRFILSEETQISVDTEGSVLDTVLALYPGNATSFGTNYATDVFGDPVPCNNDIGGANRSSRISARLPAGVYYAVVKGTSTNWGATTLPFNLSIRDESANGALGCASVADGSKITQQLEAGDYIAVLSDTQDVGEPGAGGAYSITFRDLNAVALEGGTAIGCGLGSLSSVPVEGGEKYYVVVKGNQHGPAPAPFDRGSYTLLIDDAQATQTGAGGSPIACAAEGSSIDAVYPPGEYFAVVTGPDSGVQNGDFTLRVEDVDAFETWNRIACDDDSGPNETSVIEADVEPGTHYVVVKGDGPAALGSYQLNIRDLQVDDHRIACASGDAPDQRIEADVMANRDYTVLLKGTDAFENGSYNIKLYDEEGLGSSGGALRKCQVICPNISPWTSGGTNGNPDCTSGQLSSSSFTESLAAGTYYLSVKGRRATEKGFYELQIGAPSNGSSTARYVPRTWTETRDQLLTTGAKVLPVLACNGGSECPQAQARSLSEQGCTPVVQGGQTVYRNCAGPVDPNTGQGQYYTIASNGSNIGSGLATAVRDLANYLSMDISIGVTENPFDVEVQKCTNPADAAQAAVCRSFSTGCLDNSLTPKNTVRNCQPGSTPKFLIEFTNPNPENGADTNTCASCATPGQTQQVHGVCPNCSDPNGGYHFKVQLFGDNQYLLEEIPVYIIPTSIADESMGPAPADGTYVPQGYYEQQMFGGGCYYYVQEGEDETSESCSDNVDNDNDGKIDTGRDMNDDGDFNDPGDMPPEEGCLAGSCTDGVDNDGDGTLDVGDPSCAVNTAQAWADLYYQADVPAGTSIEFDVCTGNDPTDLMSDCDYVRVATVTSLSGACSTHNECLNVMVGGIERSGFCGAGGQCQFVSPPKQIDRCSTSADCEVGTRNGEWESSFCNPAGRCEYTTPPGDVATALDSTGSNGLPYSQLRVTLRANSNASAAPTLFSWYMTYECAGAN